MTPTPTTESMVAMSRLRDIRRRRYKNYLDPSVTAKEKLRKPMCPQTEDADADADTDADDDDDDIAIT